MAKLKISARSVPWCLGLLLILPALADIDLSPGPAGAGGLMDGPRLTVLKSRDIPPYETALQGFFDELGPERENFRVEVLTLEGDGSTRQDTLGRLRKSRPDLILTLGTAATRAVLEERPGVPVIFSLVLFSSSQEILETARREGIPITGAAMDVPVRLQFEKARELLPGLGRIGVFYNPAETGAVVEEATVVAAELGLELVPVAVSSEADLQARLQGPWPDVDMLWSVADGTVFTPRTGQAILLETIRREIPFIGLSPSFVKAGALISFSCDYQSVGGQAAEKVLRVFRGEPATSIPMSRPGEVSFFLNLKTAKKIGVEVPKKFLEEAEVLF